MHLKRLLLRRPVLDNILTFYWDVARYPISNVGFHLAANTSVRFSHVRVFYLINLGISGELTFILKV